MTLHQHNSEKTAVTYSRCLDPDDAPPNYAEVPTYNPTDDEGFWDLRGFAVVDNHRFEVRYVWTWQWVVQ